MKRLKKLISLLMVAALVALIPGANALKVSAATPTTYYIKFDTDANDWRMQIGEWLEDYEGREPYYLNNGDEPVKDGDIVVVLDNGSGTASSTGLTINAHLSNLTVNRAHAVIATGGVDECHVLGESYAAISGNIANAYVYDDAVCTFNNNVTNLYLKATTTNDVRTKVSVGGTVAYAATSNASYTLSEYFNFVAGSFDFDNVSGLMTDPSKYSTTGTVAPAATGQSTTTAQTAAGTQSSTSTNSGEYDDVPKTGESNVLFMILLTISAASFAGCMALNLKRNLIKEK